MVQVHLGPPVSEDRGQITEDRIVSRRWRLEETGFWFFWYVLTDGGVAQLGERLPCTQEAIGSNPFTSTKSEDRNQRTEVRWLAALQRENKEQLANFVFVICFLSSFKKYIGVYRLQ